MNRKICVAGIGAIGGILSAMLGKKYAERLSLVARGARAEALKQHGVVLHSEFYGEVNAKPARIVESGADLDTQDYLLICVKNYSLEQIAHTLRPAIDSHTGVVPVMNGIEAGDRLREIFPDAVVCDAVIYTTTGANPDYSITQTGPYTHMFLGSKEKNQRHIDGARRLYEILKSVDFDVRWSEDIERDIWEKFILNCAFNTLTARYLTTAGAIRKDQALCRDVYELLSEAYRVGVRDGIALPDDIVQQKYNFMMEKQSDAATSSMKRDVEAKRATELDAFSGAVIRKAERYGIDVPLMKRYHQELMEMINAYSSQTR